MEQGRKSCLRYRTRQVNCITFTNWINAWSIRRGLRQLGFDLASKDPGYLLTGSATVPAPGDTLLFTEEASLFRYLGNDSFHFMPKRFPLGLLDNKFAFGEYVQYLGVAPLPQWASSAQLESDCFPVVFKARHSWLNDIKIPRGWVCRSKDDVLLAQDELAKLRLSPELYFVQKWLPVKAEDNFSVCGFWDAGNPQRNHVCVVQRMSGYGEDLSSSSVVSVVPDPDNLVARCGSILDSLDFKGPFELEFLRHKGVFYVLELNPRFWMQHGLFVSAGNGLLKRYMELDNKDDWGHGLPQHLTWIDGTWLLRMVATFRWMQLKNIFLQIRNRNDNPVICPNINDAFFCLLAVLAGKIKSCVSTLTLQWASLGRKT